MKHCIPLGLSLFAACVAPSQDGEPEIFLEPTLAPTAEPRGGAGAAAALPAATAVAIQTNGPAALVMYREGAAGTWRPAPRLKEGTYEIQVNGPYSVMMVCDFDFAASTSIFSLTPADEPLVMGYCGPFVEGPFLISGSMLQAGNVAFGDYQLTSPQSNWSFSATAQPGRHDLIASSADRAMIQRGIAISSDTTLPLIDLAQHGAPLVNTPFAVTNPFPGETLSAVAYVITPRLFQARIYRGPSPARVMPSSMLLPWERQELSLRSTVNQDFLFISRSYRTAVQSGQALQATMWDPFVGLALGNDASEDVKASWSSSLPIDYAYLNAIDYLGNYIEHFASSAYLTATGSRQVVLDTQVPGFQPAWRLDQLVYNRSFSVIQDGVVRQGYQRDDYELSNAANRGEGRADLRKTTQLERMRQVAEERRARRIQE